MRHAAHAVAAIAALALIGTAAAQGRHDEKPHGVAKPSTTHDKDRKGPAAAGGRHDERPHGMTKPKAKPADGEKPAK